MSTLKNKLVDKLGTVPEQVGPNLYRYRESFFFVSKCGVIIRNTERTRNTLKLSWSDSLEAFDWVSAVLSANDPNARKLAAVVPLLYKDTLLEVVSCGLGEETLLAIGDVMDKDYSIFMTHNDGYYRIQCHVTGDEYVAGTPQGAVDRAVLMRQAQQFLADFEK